LPASHPV